MTRSRIARPKHELGGHYDAIVVGSGYGGGIAALRLAEAGLRVCVLERGTERLPDEFPARPTDAPHNVQVTIDTHGVSTHVGDPLALFDVRVHDGLSVVQGCGVGGTSLINANVFVVPDDEQLQQGWPAAFVDDVAGRATALDRAREILRPVEAADGLAKMTVMREIGERLGQPARRLPLLVHQDDAPVEGEPVAFERCTGCGNCCAGCRVGAKRTVDATYLARASALGAEVFAELQVRAVTRTGDRWRVAYVPVCRAIEADAPEPWITAELVVLAAGALGSTEILARSRARGLSLSPALGCGFSGNGNTMGAIEAPRSHVRGTASTRRDDGEPGPCITMAIAVPGDARRPALHVEDGTVPSPIAPLARLVGMRERIAASSGGASLPRRATAALGEMIATLAEAATDADEHALALLVQHDDGATGRLELCGDRIAVRWPDYGLHTGAIDDALADAAVALGGSYRPLRPVVRGRSGHLTVHPLGGCAMADDRYLGVVDHACRVFDGAAASRTAVHDGLLVCDGSVIPKAVGKNPVGAICMVVERALALAVDAWRAAHDPPSTRMHLEPAVTLPRRSASKTERARKSGGGATKENPARRSFAMSEAFDGWLTTDVARDPGRLPRGVVAPIASPASAHFALEMTDFEAFRREPSHRAGVLGTITSDVLGGTCAVVHGVAYLLADDPVDTAQSYNLYDLMLLRPDGKQWQLSGTKVWQDGGLGRLWAAGTQMVVEVFEHDGTRGPKIATGLLRMSPRQFAGSVRSYQGRVGPRPGDGLRTGASFLAFSAAGLWARMRGRR